MVEACVRRVLCRSCPTGWRTPSSIRPEFRYRDVDELTSMLRECVVRRPAPLQARALAERFTFERLTPEYARRFAEVAERGPR